MSKPKHLSSLSVKNYRRLDELEVSRFGQVNLIVGQNNVGKSSLLETILLWGTKKHFLTIRDILFSREECNVDIPDRLHASPFLGINQLFSQYPTFEECVKKPIIISELKSNDVIKIRITKSHEADQTSRELGLDYGIAIEETDPIKQNNKTSNNKYQQSQSPLILQINKNISVTGNGISANIQSKHYLENKCIYVSPNITNSTRVPINILWEQTEIIGAETQVIDALKLIDEKIERVFFIGLNPRIPVCRVKGLSRPVPFHSMGDGISRLFEIILSIVNVAGGICLIDEFENGLHWSIQEKIWEVIFKTARNLNVQIFATTHSKDAVETFIKVADKEQNEKNKNYNNFAGIIQMRRQENKIVAQTIFGDEMRKALQYDIEVR
jgi:AAA15 family ATPase/GTPase